MQIAQFSVARASFVYTAICLQPVSLSAVLQSNQCWFRIWREGLCSTFCWNHHGTQAKVLLGYSASHVVQFFTVGGETGDLFFLSFFFSLVSDGSLKKHPRSSNTLLCFHWSRWDIVDEEKLQQFPAGGIWTQRIKNFGCTKLWTLGIFQWEGFLHLCYAGELPFIRHLRGIFWRVFFFLRNGHGLGPQGQGAKFVPSSICKSGAIR